MLFNQAKAPKQTQLTGKSYRTNPKFIIKGRRFSVAVLSAVCFSWSQAGASAAEGPCCVSILLWDGEAAGAHTWKALQSREHTEPLHSASRWHQLLLQRPRFLNLRGGPSSLSPVSSL